MTLEQAIAALTRAGFDVRRGHAVRCAVACDAAEPENRCGIYSCTAEADDGTGSARLATRAEMPGRSGQR